MGRVKTHDIKKVSFELIERDSGKFTTDFQNNKEVVEGVKVANSKRMRNKIAGYITCIMKRRSR